MGSVGTKSQPLEDRGGHGGLANQRSVAVEGLDRGLDTSSEEGMPGSGPERGVVDPISALVLLLEGDETAVTKKRIKASDNLHVGVEVNATLLAQGMQPHIIA